VLYGKANKVKNLQEKLAICQKTSSLSSSSAH
jgi:hypothetical protein